jgi:hypothetical protein
MDMKDWEVHASKLWHKDSAKFAKPTPRQLEQPTLQIFEPTDGCGDIVVGVTTLCALGVVIVLAVVGAL